MSGISGHIRWLFAPDGMAAPGLNPLSVCFGLLIPGQRGKGKVDRFPFP